MKTTPTLSTNGGNFQHSLEKGVDTATVAAHHTIDSASEAARPALDHLVTGAHGAVDSAGAAPTRAAETLGHCPTEVRIRLHLVERVALQECLDRSVVDLHIGRDDLRGHVALGGADGASGLTLDRELAGQ